MKHIILLALIVACGRQASLPKTFVANQTSNSAEVASEAESNYQKILSTQEHSLNSMSEAKGSFQMKEMITDISVAKTGLLGLSALKANSGVEIWWARKAVKENTPVEKTDLTIESDTTTEEAVDSIVALAEASGKVKAGPGVRANIARSLSQIQNIVDEAGAGIPGHWQFKGIRFDLNFAVSGEVLFFTKAGTNLRLRMEWNHTKKPAKSTSQGSKFVKNTLTALNAVQSEITLPGFSPKMICLGVGTTYKGQLGIWKVSPGFIGWLQFVPKATKELSLPELGTKEDFLLGGYDDKGLGMRTLSHEKMVAGLRQSLKTANYFADAAATSKGSWYVSMIRTVNDISYTGLFGLADFTTKGVMEIDFKRNI